MSVEQFTVQPSSNIGTIALIILVVTGVALLILALTTGRRAKTVRHTLIGLLVIGIAVIGLGVGLFYATSTPSTITVGSGYVSIQSPSFNGAGNLKVTSNQIISAYVGQIGSGNLALAKQHGTNYNQLKVGVFTLGNGATAYVASTNSTDLIIQLNNGQYVILGTSNTNVLATSFSNSVYRLNSTG